MNNKTSQDARSRITLASAGSLVDPSPEYLHALRHDLFDWLNKIEKTIDSLSDDSLPESSDRILRDLVSEIIHKCDGDSYCLYTKHKGKNGKRRRLGKHSSKAGAEAQEKAIHSHGG